MLTSAHGALTPALSQGGGGNGARGAQRDQRAVLAVGVDDLRDGLPVVGEPG